MMVTSGGVGNLDSSRVETRRRGEVRELDIPLPPASASSDRTRRYPSSVEFTEGER